MALDNFKNSLHALTAGMLMTHLQRHGLDAMPLIDDDGDFTPRYIIKDEHFPGGQVIVTLEPPDE